VEVYGPEAVPVFGKLPGERRMYTLPAGQGEHHLIGSQVMTRVSRSQETGGTRRGLFGEIQWDAISPGRHRDVAE